MRFVFSVLKGTPFRNILMAFYRNWIGTNDKKEAFRSAQAQLKQKYPDPYFWGAFVMIGE